MKAEVLPHASQQLGADTFLLRLESVLIGPLSFLFLFFLLHLAAVSFCYPAESVAKLMGCTFIIFDLSMKKVKLICSLMK